MRRETSGLVLVWGQGGKPLEVSAFHSFPVFLGEFFPPVIKDFLRVLNFIVGGLKYFETTDKLRGNGEIEVPVRMVSTSPSCEFNGSEERPEGLPRESRNFGGLHVETDFLEGPKTTHDPAKPRRVLFTLQESSEVPSGNTERVFSNGPEGGERERGDSPGPGRMQAGRAG